VGFVRDALENFSSKIAAAACNALVAILTARLLGVGGRGEYALFVSLVALAAMAFHLGMPQANVYFHARRDMPLGRLAANSRVLSLAVAVLCGLALLAFRDVILRRFLPGIDPVYLWLIVPTTFFIVLDAAYAGMALGRQQFRLYNVRQAALPAVVLVATVVCLIPVQTGVEGAILARAAAIVAVAVWFVATVGNRLELERAPFDMGLAKKTLAYGMKSHIQGFVWFMNWRLGLFLLSFFAGREAAGYYSVATALAEPAWFVAASFGTILFPKLSATEPEEAFRFTCVVCRNIFVITLVLCLGLLVLGRHLVVLLFGEAYMASLIPLYILLPGTALMTLYIILTRSFSSRNRQGMSILACVVALVFNVALNLVLVPRYGVSGAALAVSAAYAVEGLVILAAFVHDSELAWHKAVFPRREDLVYYRRLLGLRP